jgi:hypothetical protein
MQRTSASRLTACAALCTAARIALLAAAAGGSAAQVAAAGDATLAQIQVNAQGRFCNQVPSLERHSPLGTCALAIEPLAADGSHCIANLGIAARHERFRLLRQEGSEFLISDVGRLVIVDGPDADAPPSVLRVLDFAGAELWRAEVAGFANPQLSPDGAYLAYRTRAGLVQLDLQSCRTWSYPIGYLFAQGPDGLLAVLAPAHRGHPAGAGDDAGWKLLIGRRGEVQQEFPVGTATPLRMAFSPAGEAVLLLERESLQRVTLGDGTRTSLFSAPPGARLRDLRVGGDAIAVGIRHPRGDGCAGEIALVSPAGEVLDRRPGPEELRAPAPDRGAAAGLPEPSAGGRALPWPFTPPHGHPIGNTYGEYQNYGGAGYMHPGVDLFGDPGQAVYAVHAGQVKAVLTTSGQWHWRVAVADTATTGYSTGYLYAHLDEPSIAVDVGDNVTLGQYLGNLVEWPSYNFTHCHFARIRDSGAQWYGNWLCTDNPHLDFTGHVDPDPPLFEHAHGTDWFAFCTNQTSTYLSPTALRGQVDIIAHVGDVIGSDWVCTVQEIRYSIYPTGHPSLPVVDDKLAVYYDMWLDTYPGGPQDPFLVELLYKRDSVCRTEGDYDHREFYHIITNSDGNQIYEDSDLWEAWDTSQCPDTEYIVEVTAWDVAGNAATVSMPVRVSNGGVASVSTEPGARLAPIRQVASSGAAFEIAFETAQAGHVGLTVHDLLGRQISRVVDGEVPPGPHTARWNGRDARGRPVDPGAYFIRLTTPSGDDRRRVLIVR